MCVPVFGGKCDDDVKYFQLLSNFGKSTSDVVCNQY